MLFSISVGWLIERSAAILVQVAILDFMYLIPLAGFLLSYGLLLYVVRWCMDVNIVSFINYIKTCMLQLCVGKWPDCMLRAGACIQLVKYFENRFSVEF